MQPFEARIIDREMPGYFAHGIAISPGDTVLDLGANIGLFGLRAMQRCGGDLALYCVEPIPQIRAQLERNLGPRVTIIPWAIGDSAGTALLEYFPLVSGTSGIRGVIPDDARWVEVVEVMASNMWFGRFGRLVPRALFGFVARRLRAGRVIVRCERRTISDLLDRYGLGEIALLKLDIEGSELDALRGITEAHWPQIQQVVAEIHERKRDLSPIKALLEAHDFVVMVGERPCIEDDCCILYAKRPELG